MVDAEQFYDGFADEYDTMTQFIPRLGQQEDVLGALLKRYPGHSAIDMGCGTGVHAIALDRLGINVTGVDISAKMLARAREHAGRLESSARFVHGNFLTPFPAHSADLIFCLGNSLPHLASGEELTRVLHHWHTLLAPGGRVIIQLLNYEQLLKKQERIVNIRRSDGRMIIRFYDFLDDGLRFNILTVNEESSGPPYTLRSTPLTPFTRHDIQVSARAAKFTSVDIFSNLKNTPFASDGTNCVGVLA